MFPLKVKKTCQILDKIILKFESLKIDSLIAICYLMDRKSIIEIGMPIVGGEYHLDDHNINEEYVISKPRLRNLDLEKISTFDKNDSELCDYDFIVLDEIFLFVSSNQESSILEFILNLPEWKSNSKCDWIAILRSENICQEEIDELIQRKNYYESIDKFFM